MAEFDEFLDDFYAECDEHLSAARQAVLDVERNAASGFPYSEAIETLFRCFHSLKGLSAMVGLRRSEELAHCLEGYLSAVQKGQARLSDDGLTILIDGIRTTEEILQANQSRSTLPDIRDICERVLALSTIAANPTDDAEHSTQAPSEALTLALWRFRFTPSAEVAARGINVNEVRNRLSRIGTIVQAEPVVLPGGAVEFHFLVRSTVDEEVFAAWTADSITCERLSDATSPIEPAAAIAAPRSDERRPTSSPVIRVDLPRLDELMRLVGELVITRARLDEQIDRLRPSNPEANLRSLLETSSAFERQIRDLREGVTRMRLVPLREVFARLRFVVQDLARHHEGELRLQIEGDETEVDKFIVDSILDPLLHLVRNAIAHGMESTDERLAAGKLAVGQLRISASVHGEAVQICVEDDGRGIRIDEVQAKARSMGIIPHDAIVDTKNLLEVICLAGLSTREEADRASGRGMGMSAVVKAIEHLAGELTLQTTAGQGTRFTIRLPLSLYITDALVVEIAQQRFVVPQATVQEVIDLETAHLASIEGNQMLRTRGAVMPVFRLATLFALSQNSASSAGLVVGADHQEAVLAVDRIVGLEEIVVRPLIDPLLRVPGISGATELGDGNVVLIVDPMGAVRAARGSASKAFRLGQNQRQVGVN